MALEFELSNARDGARFFELEGSLQWVLRTCQSYAWVRPARVECTLKDPADPLSGCPLATASFDAPETDSTLIFVANAGALPAARSTLESLSLSYQKRLRPGENGRIVLLLGSCRQAKRRPLPPGRPRMQDEVTAYGRRRSGMQQPAFTGGARHRGCCRQRSGPRGDGCHRHISTPDRADATSG